MDPTPNEHITYMYQKRLDEFESFCIKNSLIHSIDIKDIRENLIIGEIKVHTVSVCQCGCGKPILKEMYKSGNLEFQNKTHISHEDAFQFMCVQFAWGKITTMVNPKRLSLSSGVSIQVKKITA